MSPGPWTHLRRVNFVDPKHFEPDPHPASISIGIGAVRLLVRRTVVRCGAVRCGARRGLTQPTASPGGGGVHGLAWIAI